MKLSLKIFFAGVGVGILLTIVGFVLGSGARPAQRTGTTGVWEISASTNEPVKYKRVVHRYP